MGQRTNLLLSMENKAGARLNKVYHLQWGYGKVMPIMLLNILSGQYIGVSKEKQNFFASVVPKTDDLFELQRDYSCFRNHIPEPQGRIPVSSHAINHAFTDSRQSLQLTQ